MNIRAIIRDTIESLVEIDREEIENAVMELDIQDMITDAINEQLPEAIRQTVIEEIDSAVEEAIDGALS